MKHQIAIEVLQDRIIYLTGQVVMTKQMELKDFFEESMIKTFTKEIDKLKESQEVLKNQ